MNPGRLSVINSPLRTLIRNAYQVPDYTISGGPGWISDRYDIEAKVDGELKRENSLLLLRALLEDRFQLKVHRETKEGPIYALTVAAGGLKLQPSNCVVVDPVRRSPPPAVGEKRPENCGSVKGAPANGPVRTLSVTGLKMDETDSARVGIPGLNFYLSSILGRAVVDKTGLTGRFDIRLEYTPAELESATDNPAPSIFTAVQEQLGLKLESTRGPVELLIIDRVERPSEN